MTPSLSGAAPWALVALTLVPATARAFTFESSFSRGCHESITFAAVARAGWPRSVRPAPLDTDTVNALSRDLPFTLPDGARDLWSITLLLGARENDLHGASPRDLTRLFEVHTDPAFQDEHCLRRPQDDGPEGNLSALAACRAFILREVDLALGDGDQLDLEATEPHAVSLAFSGERDVSLPRYAWHMGRALHALQDSFAHTLRSPDGRRVRSVLNFTDQARDPSFEPSRDGYGHISALDECADHDSADAQRTRLAGEASEALLRALVDDTMALEGRRARAAAVVDEWLTYEPGCTAANAWCDAPEVKEDQSGCLTRPGRTGRAGAAWALLGAAAAWARRRRAAVASMALAAAFLSSADAQAQTRPDAGRWGVNLRVGASVDRGALAVSLGAHRHFGERVTVGLSAEYNPWIAYVTGNVAAGTFNAYATGAFAWARTTRLAVYSSVHLGASVLLTDLVGAEAGATGIFAGASLLAMRLAFGDHLRLLVEPASVIAPVPQLRGVPLVYLQYRATVGVAWDF